MVVWGLPFIGIGLYLLFGRFLQTLYLRDKTFYIITNKKLIIRSGNKVRIYRAEDLPPMDFALENIADVAGAQNALGRMER